MYVQVLENSGFGADKFKMVRNPDGSGSLIVVQPLDFEDTLHRNGFRFRIQVNDQVSSTHHGTIHREADSTIGTQVLQPTYTKTRSIC